MGAKIIRTRRVQPINQTKSSLQDGTAVGIDGMAVGSALGITGASEEGETVGT